jgi:hypothetical protein
VNNREQLPVPEYRVHLAISSVNNEILVSPLSKHLLSPYFEEKYGYFWSEGEPVSVIPFDSSSIVLGNFVKATIQISKLHYKAPEAAQLLELRKKRREDLIAKFGKGNPRFHQPMWSLQFVASSAVSDKVFQNEYIHLIVEDAQESHLGLLITGSFTKSDLQPYQTQVSATCSDDELGQAILNLIGAI